MRQGTGTSSSPLPVRVLALAAALALGAAGLAPAQPAPAAPDPFYLSLLQEGIVAYEEGDAAGAAKALRLACFGLLEDPAALAGCLVRLGVAQTDAGDREAFFETFRRLLAVEQRFRVYRRAELPAKLRQEFEDSLVRLVPEQQLAAVEAFAPLAFERAEVKIRRLPPREREKELASRLGAEPGHPRWSLLLAELEVEQGKASAALARADAVLAGAPGDLRARCVRGLARAAGGACPAAVDDLLPCPESRADPVYAEALLGCMVALGNWDLARDLLAALSPELREDRKVARLVQRVEREGSASPAPASPPSEAGASAIEPPGAAEPPPRAAPAPPMPSSPAPGQVDALSPADHEKLERAQQLAADIQHAGQLVEPMRLASEVALANPGSREAQHLAALLAYRASRWQEAVTYFRRGGDPGDDRPVLLFYLAVACYETGDREAAAAALERALPKLEKTPLVESYRRKILGEESEPG